MKLAGDIVSDPDSDVRLCTELALGNNDAMAVIYQRHGPACYALARRVSRNSGIAQDVVQDVFVGLWQQPQRFDPTRGSLRSLLLARTHGRCVDILRSETSRERRQHRDAVAREHQSSIDVSTEVVDADRDRLVRRAVASLDPRQRQAIELAYFDGHSYRAVAELLGVAEGTIKGRIRAGLHTLRQQVASLPGE